MKTLRFVMGCCTVAVIACALLGWRTGRAILPFPESLSQKSLDVRRPQVLDRHGTPLSMTYQNTWNIHDQAQLHEIPILLQQCFIQSEDRRFYRHGGVDWAARLHAALQNVLALRAVRGASTITEQVVRLLHPRPRSLWSRWLEGFEASRLEASFSKTEILEFYLNQVPYAHQRRGVVQAARFYFNRDLQTLSPKEMMGLAVLVRSPAGLDLKNKPGAIERGIARLAQRLKQQSILDEEQYEAALSTPWDLADFRLPLEAGHFVNHVYRHFAAPSSERHSQPRLISTLDSALQQQVQQILDSRIQDLHAGGVTDGAVLVLDHLTHEVLAWVNGGGLRGDQRGSWIDAVTTPRQPGSTLKPFLYALALEKGQTAATLIDDSPLAQPVGSGLHSFHNYSRTHYGLLRLRDALGNSLNIPAVRTIQFVGIERFLQRLHLLGFHTLKESSEHYGEGLALGNGEVTLLELVRAYAVLARGGVFHPLRVLRNEEAMDEGRRRRVYSEEDASLTANILADPQARRMEFGEGNLLRFPVQTAVKTGTSNDHRDAWAVGFSHRYTAGVWLGDLDRKPTSGVTGTSGSGLVLRAVFAELNRYEELKPLTLSPSLLQKTICRVNGLAAGPHCPSMIEWFKPGEMPLVACTFHGPSRLVERRAKEEQPIEDRGRVQAPPVRESTARPRLIQPTQGLQLALDPRVPGELQAFALMLPRDLNPSKVEWVVDGKIAGVSGRGEYRFLWPLSRGTHTAQARLWRPETSQPDETPIVRFVVN